MLLVFNWHSVYYVTHNQAPSAYSYLLVILVNGACHLLVKIYFMYNISSVTCCFIMIPFLILWPGTKYCIYIVTFQKKGILACHLEDSKPQLPKLVVNEWHIVYNWLYMITIYGSQMKCTTCNLNSSILYDEFVSYSFPMKFHTINFSQTTETV